MPSDSTIIPKPIPKCPNQALNGEGNGMVSCRKLEWPIAFSLVLFFFAFATPSQAAFGPAPITNKKYTDGKPSAVEKMLETVGRIAESDGSLKRSLEEARSRIFLVFVPGILGSKISIDGDVVWGDGVPTDQQLAKLALPQTLIDEGSDDRAVKVSLLRSIMGVDMYGEAVDRLRATADNLGIGFIECPYDWRRDIRAAARHVEEDCLAPLTQSPEQNTPAAIIFVSHSMGGIVTWEWYNRYYRPSMGARPQNTRLLAVAVLGSPLLGSCEILRMIKTGYAQPDESNVSDPDDYWERFEEWLGGRVTKAIVNPITRFFSQEMRKIIFTWPGAFELTPQHSLEPQNHCIPKRLPDAIAGDDRVHSYYDLSFWESPLGKDFREKDGALIPLPSQFQNVLNKAREFRLQFKPDPLSVPTMFFYSKSWGTPSIFKLTRSDRLPAGDDITTTTNGDGRVPLVSALGHTNTDNRWGMDIPSVHGELLKDKRFKEWFDDRRLPEIINAYLSTIAAELISSNENQLLAYVSAGGDAVPLSEVEAAYVGYRTEKRLVSFDTTAIRQFNTALRKISGWVLPDRASLKRLRRNFSGMGTAKQNKDLATNYDLIMQATPLPMPKRTQDLGQIGLALHRSRSRLAAIIPLSRSLSQMEKLPQFQTGSLLKLKRIVTRNLGVALFNAGECLKAEKHLRKTLAERTALGIKWLGDNRFEKLLKTPCKDRETNAKIIFSAQ